MMAIKASSTGEKKKNLKIQKLSRTDMSLKKGTVTDMFLVQHPS